MVRFLHTRYLQGKDVYLVGGDVGGVGADSHYVCGFYIRECIISTTSVPYFSSLWWGSTIWQSIVKSHKFLVVFAYGCSNFFYDLPCLVSEKVLLSVLRVSNVHSSSVAGIRILQFFVHLTAFDITVSIWICLLSTYEVEDANPNFKPINPVEGDPKVRWLTYI